MTKAFVLHSGGIDSTTCLYLAIGDVGLSNTTAISMHYGQRHSKEIESAIKICERLGVPHRTAKMADQPPSMLTDDKQEIPGAKYEDFPEGKSPTYVPFRNGQMLSYITALATAEVPEDDTYIYFGAHAEDAHNWAYADCTPEFIGAMASAIYIGSYHKARLRTPLEWLNKHQIIQLGHQFDIPWELTWSCYAGGEKHCGTCPTCQARHRGFMDAGIFDPTEYAVEMPPQTIHVE